MSRVRAQRRKKRTIHVEEASEDSAVQLAATSSEEERPPSSAVSRNCRARGYCLTSFGCVPLTQCITIASSLECLYAIFGQETCPSTGRAHVQGYLYWNNPKQFTRVVRLLSGTALQGSHLTAAKGSPQQNQAYCMKDGDYQEYGTCPVMGQRTDMDKVRTWLAEKTPMKEAVSQATSLQSLKGYLLLRGYYATKRSAPPQVRWYHGPTGLGKTRQAHEEALEIVDNDPDKIYWKNGTKWWDFYDPTVHTVVIIDELRPDAIGPYSYLLQLLDRYPFLVEYKGGSVDFSAPHIFITSCHSPEVFGNQGDSTTQLVRRLSCVKEFSTPEST